MAPITAIDTFNPSAQVMVPLIDRLFLELDHHGICYVLLRAGDDIDLLVAPKHLVSLRALLEPLGFVAPAYYGMTPHHFFVGYDIASGTWIKLDVVTELAYGHRVAALRTGLARDALAHRQRRDGVWHLAPAEEFLTLLLHCVLDKGKVDSKYWKRLTILAEDITPDVASHIESHLPAGASLHHIRQAILNSNWERLLDLRPALIEQLTRRDRLGTLWRRSNRRIVRAVDRRTRRWRTPGMAVALLGPDGAGKTTLAQALCRSFFLPGRLIYMGSNPQSSSLLPTSRWLARLQQRRSSPLVRTARAANTRLENVVRLGLAAFHRRFGRLVVYDRFPIKMLEARRTPSTRLWFKPVGRTRQSPDIVIYLDAPGELLFQRKGEHSPEVLERQRERMRDVAQTLETAVVIDARQDPDAIRREVTTVLWRHYGALVRSHTGSYRKGRR